MFKKLLMLAFIAGTVGANASAAGQSEMCKITYDNAAGAVLTVHVKNIPAVPGFKVAFIPQLYIHYMGTDQKMLGTTWQDPEYYPASDGFNVKFKRPIFFSGVAPVEGVLDGVAFEVSYTNTANVEVARLPVSWVKLNAHALKLTKNNISPKQITVDMASCMITKADLANLLTPEEKKAGIKVHNGN